MKSIGYMGLDDVTLLKYSKGQYVPCSKLHPGIHCLTLASTGFLKCFALSSKTYLMLYAAQMLIFNRKRALSNPKQSLAKLVKSVLRSCLYASVIVALGKLVICYFKEINHGFGPTEQLLGAYLSSFTVYCESPQRRLAIVKWLFPRALETLWRIGVGKGLLRDVPSGEYVLFSLTMGTLMMFYNTEPRLLEQSVVSSLRWIYGDN